MLHFHLWNGYYKIGGTKEDPIQYMTKLELIFFLLSVELLTLI